MITCFIYKDDVTNLLVRLQKFFKMIGRVILVCIEVGREITDYALEWAVLNVIKPMDSLVVLAIIPSHECDPLPVKNNQPRSKGFFSRKTNSPEHLSFVNIFKIK